MDHPASSVCLFFFHCAFHSVTESQAGNWVIYQLISCFVLLYMPYILHNLYTILFAPVQC